jgi:hypothetical protein
MGIVVREGEVWVHKCEWIDQSDTEDPCAAMARIRVWPSFKKAKPWISAVYALVPAKPKWKLPTVAPKDCQATARESQGRKRNRHEVACHCKGEKPQAIEVCEDTAYNPSTSVRWLAPRTLLIEADDCDTGSSEYRSSSLAKACHPESLKDVQVQAGPQGVWMLCHDGQVDRGYGFTVPAGLEAKRGEHTCWVLRGSTVLGNAPSGPVDFAQLP